MLYDDLKLPQPGTPAFPSAQVSASEDSERGETEGAWDETAAHADSSARTAHKRGFARVKSNSTCASVLAQLSTLHPLPGFISQVRSQPCTTHCFFFCSHAVTRSASLSFQHRKLSHLMTHYVDLLGKYSFADPTSRTHRIFSTIQQTHVPTGRVAFTDPNLQAIAHAVSFQPLCSQPGARAALESSCPSSSCPSSSYSLSDATLTVSVRNSFVASPGCVLMSADYSQLEVRVCGSAIYCLSVFS